MGETVPLANNSITHGLWHFLIEGAEDKYKEERGVWYTQ